MFLVDIFNPIWYKNLAMQRMSLLNKYNSTFVLFWDISVFATYCEKFFFFPIFFSLLPLIGSCVTQILNVLHCWQMCSVWLNVPFLRSTAIKSWNMWTRTRHTSLIFSFCCFVLMCSINATWYLESQHILWEIHSNSKHGHV